MNVWKGGSVRCSQLKGTARYDTFNTPLRNLNTSLEQGNGTSTQSKGGKVNMHGMTETCPYQRSKSLYKIVRIALISHSEQLSFLYDLINVVRYQISPIWFV